MRRVATLVAEAAPRQDIYAAVAAEIAQRLGADAGAVLRYEASGTATIVGGWGVPGLQIPIGSRLLVEGEGVVASVWRTRRPARIERFDGPPGSAAARFRSLGLHTARGEPHHRRRPSVGRRVRCHRARGAYRQEVRSASPSSLNFVAAAIANAEARGEVRRIADEQTALRRVATLVARGVPAGQVFDAVTSETRQCSISIPASCTGWSRRAWSQWWRGGHAVGRCSRRGAGRRCLEGQSSARCIPADRAHRRLRGRARLVGRPSAGVRIRRRGVRADRRRGSSVGGDELVWAMGGRCRRVAKIV